MTKVADTLSVGLTNLQWRGDFLVTTNPARSFPNFDDFLFLARPLIFHCYSQKRDEKTDRKTEEGPPDRPAKNTATQTASSSLILGVHPGVKSDEKFRQKIRNRSGKRDENQGIKTGQELRIWWSSVHYRSQVKVGQVVALLIVWSGRERDVFVVSVMVI
jgi:hypothetical protein